MANKVGGIEIVLKGGRPWGFRMQGGIENGRALVASEIEPGGKADLEGSLRPGDQVLKINDVPCLSLTEAYQLVDSAFKTLTLLVWRSSSLSGDQSLPSASVHKDPGHRESAPNLWQRASSLRQSLKQRTSSNKSNKSDQKNSLRLNRSSPHYQSEGKGFNRILREQKREWGSHNDLSRERKNRIAATSAGDRSTLPPDLNSSSVNIRHHRHSVSVEDDRDTIDKLYANIQAVRHQDAQSPMGTSSSSQPNSSVVSSQGTRHQRSPRKLTKDSGYETSAPGEPDYVNTEWMTESKTKESPNAECGNYSLKRASLGSSSSLARTYSEKIVDDPRNPPGSRLSVSSNKIPWDGRYLQRSQSYSQDSSRARLCKEEDRYLSGRPQDQHAINHFSNSDLTAEWTSEQSRALNSRYSSTDSLTHWSGGHHVLNAKSTPALPQTVENDRLPIVHPPSWNVHPVSPSHSTPNLDQDIDMVTRRFKKGSVYETLASQSGLDFAPIVQNRPYWERLESSRDYQCARLGSKKTDPNAPGLPKVSASTNDLDSKAIGKVSLKSLPAKHHFASEDNISSSGQQQALLSKSADMYSKENQLGEASLNSVENDARRKSPSPPALPHSGDSSLKLNKDSSTHEKYPSWPVTSANSVDSSQVSSSNHRSHSWTESTSYPKEKVVYSRPKKSYKILPHQLQPVLERSSETSNRRSASSEEELQRQMIISDLDPSLKHAIEKETSKPFDFDSLCRTSYSSRKYTDKDYNVPSPPERDVPNDKPSSADQSTELKHLPVEAYLNKYDEFLKLYSQDTAGMHSGSSYTVHPLTWSNKPGEPHLPPDSMTPFLDRLRRESELMPHMWPFSASNEYLETPSEVGTCIESVDSGSSQETLKWHGSSSDISSFSVQVSNRSSLFDSGHSSMPDSGRLSPQSSCDGSASTTSYEGSTRVQLISRLGYHHRENVVHSSRVQPPKRHESESVLYYAPDLKHGNHRFSKSFSNHERESVGGLDSRLMHISNERKQRADSDPKSQGFTSSFPGFNKTSFGVGHCVQSSSSGIQFSANSSQAKYVEQSWAKTNLSKLRSSWENSSSRSFCYSINGDEGRMDKSGKRPGSERSSPDKQPTNDVSKDGKNTTPTSPHRLSESEESPSRIVYLDPDKKHRVSDPELKAIQKQAVLSFYERQKSLAARENQSNQTGQDNQYGGSSLLSNRTTDASLDSQPLSPTSKSQSFPRNALSLSRWQHQQHWEVETIGKVGRAVAKLGRVPEHDPVPSDVFRSHNSLPVSNAQQQQQPKRESPSRATPSLSGQHSISVPNLTEIHLQSPVKMSDASSRLSGDSQWSSQQDVVTSDKGSPSVPHITTITLRPENRVSITDTEDSGSTHTSLEGKRTPTENGSSPSPTSTMVSDCREDGNIVTSAANYFRSHKTPRKAQLKEVRHSNEKSTVEVLTADGVTVAESVKERKESVGEVGIVKNGCISIKCKPVPPPPPQPPSRPPAPPPPPSPPPLLKSLATRIAGSEENDEEDAELKNIEEQKSHQQNAILQAMNSRPHVQPTSCSPPSAGEGASTCSSPDLPPPPPPSTTDTEVLPCDDPLPPPPDPKEVELTTTRSRGQTAL